MTSGLATLPYRTSCRACKSGKTSFNAYLALPSDLFTLDTKRSTSCYLCTSHDQIQYGLSLKIKGSQCTAGIYGVACCDLRCEDVESTALQNMWPCRHDLFAAATCLWQLRGRSCAALQVFSRGCMGCGSCLLQLPGKVVHILLLRLVAQLCCPCWHAKV